MVKQTPEGKVKKQIDALLEQYQCYSIKPATGGYGVSGALDYACNLSRLSFYIEAKAGNGKVSALQHNQILKIMESGAIAIVVGPDDMTELENILRLMEQTIYDPLGNGGSTYQIARVAALHLCESWGIDFPEEIKNLF